MDPDDVFRYNLFNLNEMCSFSFVDISFRISTRFYIDNNFMYKSFPVII